VRAFESGDSATAGNLHRQLFPLFKDLFIEPNPVPVKTALGWHGRMSGEVRLPLCEMSEANQARLRKTLDEFEHNSGLQNPHQTTASSASPSGRG
jgi:4-hydroxy-tetrahydrodipicolinate synthase